MACGGCGSDRTYTLQLIDKEAHNSFTYSFKFASLEPLDWQEGHSSKLLLPRDGVLEGKKFSYVSMPDENEVIFTTRISEACSDYKEQLKALEVGDFVEVSEPGGSFNLQRRQRPIIILSNGVGIAAVRSLVKAYELDQEGIQGLTQINIDRGLRLYETMFDEVSEQGINFNSFYETNRSDFYQQLDFESQNMMFKTGFIPYFYVVGSDDFVLDVTAHLMSVGVDEEDIVTDGDQSGCGCGSGSSGCGCSGSGCG